MNCVNIKLMCDFKTILLELEYSDKLSLVTYSPQVLMSIA